MAHSTHRSETKATPKIRPPPEGKESTDNGKEISPGIHSQVPITSNDFLRLNQNITSWEREEVTHYDKVFFYGPKARKIDAAKGQPYNNGFDDESGSYIKVLNDHLMYRYEVLEVIGKVSYTTVIKANVTSGFVWVSCKSNRF